MALELGLEAEKREFTKNFGGGVWTFEYELRELRGKVMYHVIKEIDQFGYALPRDVYFETKEKMEKLID